MNVYLASLIATSALVGISSYISFSDTGGGTVRTALSLIIICTVINPVVSLVREVERLEIGEYELEEFIPEINESEFGKNAKDAFEDGVKKFICEKFSLNDSEVRVVLIGFDTINMKTEKIKVTLYGDGAYSDLRGIAYEISSLGVGECEVEIGVR